MMAMSASVTVLYIAILTESIVAEVQMQQTV